VRDGLGPEVTDGSLRGGFTEATAVARDQLGDLGSSTGVLLSEVPAPGRVAPQSWALGGDVPAPRPDDDPLASGRLVVLHDLAGQDGWDGDTRLVAFARAVVEDDIGRDPLVAEVAWAWLTEALDQQSATHRALGGTVTVTSSRTFGLLADEHPVHGSAGPEICEVEVRASWSLDQPCHGAVLVPHVRAWCSALSHFAGRPPSTPDVLPLRRQ
jgi:hypothetical protein